MNKPPPLDPPPAEIAQALAALDPALDADLDTFRALLAQGRFGEAANVLAEIKDAGPQRAYTRYNYGVALIKDGRVGQGLNVLDRVGQAVAGLQHERRRLRGVQQVRLQQRLNALRLQRNLLVDALEVLLLLQALLARAAIVPHHRIREAVLTDTRIRWRGTAADRPIGVGTAIAAVVRRLRVQAAHIVGA